MNKRMNKILVAIASMLVVFGAFAPSAMAWKNVYYGYVSGYQTWCDTALVWEYNGTRCNTAHQERKYASYTGCYMGTYKTIHQTRPAAVFDPTWGAPYLLWVRSYWTTTYIDYDTCW